MLRTVGVRGDERKVDVGGTHAGKFDFSLFRRLLDSLHSHLIFREVDAFFRFEIVDDVIHNSLIEIVAAEHAVTVGGKNLEHSVADIENGHIERAAAEIVNHDLMRSFILIESVSKSRRRGFVDDTKHVQARDFACVLCCLSLTVREVCGAGDDGVLNGFAEISLRVLFKFRKNHCGNFLRGILLAVDSDLIIATHMSFNGYDRSVAVGNRLTFSNLTDESFAVFLETNHRGGCSRTFCVCYNDRLAAFHNGYARICCS